MEHVPYTLPVDEDKDEKRINSLMDQIGVSHNRASEMLGIPVQRESEETGAQPDYDPPRDERGRELPGYYGKTKPPLDGPAARTQDEINRAGSLRA
jgi:hypothetical protein